MQHLPLNTSLALVTGAASGIGKATVEALLAKGARVICAGRRRETLQALAGACGGRALALELDVDDPGSVDSVPQRLPGDWRDVDILINNAGHDRGGRRTFEEGSAEQWTAIIETNVNGLIRITRCLIGGMLERGRGHVVNMGSVSGLKAYATGTAYAASKFAVHGFSESLRLDYRNRGVRVSEILPGLVATEFALRRWADPATAANFYGGADSLLAPADVAAAVIYALEQPAHVNIAQIVIMPCGQD